VEFRQLLQRYVQVCNTIAYAHSRGIVHRDLKPHNVMLGRFGETLVVDWGLAKEVAGNGAEETPSSLPAVGSGPPAATETGALVGTPRYMAPEQAAGDHAAVGPASDVYGLGAVLYALLTGQDPYAGYDLYSVPERVRRGELAPPRRLNPAVPPALEAVCLKAMAWWPGDRYPSALDLAADVERWLADEPVSVHREPRLDRLRRWGRRHRPLVAASVALLLTAVAGLTLTVVLVSRQQAVTAAEKRRAEEQRDRADRNFELARQAVEATATRISGHPRLLAADFHDLRADLLAALAPFYDELARQGGDDPATEMQRGLADGFLGHLRGTLGQTDEALGAYRRMIQVFNRLAARDPAETEYRRRLAQAHNDLGLMLHEAGRLDDAHRELLEAVRRKRELCDEAPDSLKFQHGLAVGLNSLALVNQAAGQVTEAEANFRAALTAYERLVAQRPRDAETARQLAAVQDNFGVLLKGRGRPAEAEVQFRAATDRRAKLLADRPRDPTLRRDLAVSRFNLANLLLAAGRFAEAEPVYRAALAVARPLAAEFPGVPAHRRDLANACSNFGVLLAASGRAEEAAPLFQEAVTLFEKLAAEFPDVPGYRAGLAGCYYNLGEHWQDRAKVADPRTVARRAVTALAFLAGALRGDLARSEDAFRRAADLYAKLAADDPSSAQFDLNLTGTWVALGELSRSAGAPAAALEWYQRAIARLEAPPAAGAPPAHNALCNAYVGRAAVLLATGRPAEAVAAFDRAVGLADEPHRSALRLSRALALALAGDHRRATAEARELASAPGSSANALDTLARVFALAAAGAQVDPPTADDFARQSVDLLRRARAAGGYRAAGAADQLRRDGHFAALRGREDFEAFLRGLTRPKE
jgi:serine/threonine-protein kinase